MQIPTSAVRKYLERPFADFRVYKRLPDVRLNAIAQQYRIAPTLWCSLRRPQKIMVTIGLRTRRFAFFADTGVGKTRTILALIEHLKAQRQLKKRVLVLVPRRTVKDEWLFEVEKHAPDLDARAMPSNIDLKWQVVETDDSLIVVETYASIVKMVCETVPSRKRGKNQFKPNKAWVKRLCAEFDMVILDESQNAKHKLKLPFRICRQLAKHCTWLFALSATPHGRDPADLWAQLYLVDDGKTLGETLGLFRAVYMNEENTFWGGPAYTFRKEREKLLHKILANSSIRFPANEADLPRLVPVIKYSRLPEEAEVYYERARQTLLRGHNYREMKNSFLRMRQISSGFVGFHDDDAGRTAEFEFAENPKLDQLMGLLESIDERHKIIVFYEFTWSSFRIIKELRTLRMDAPAHLWSGSRDTKQIRRRFASDPRCRVLLIQNSFGVGLNLQAAKYGIFYETPIAPDLRYQCTRRFERQGTEHDTVFSYDLVVRGTYDEKILGYLKEGKNIFEAIIEGKSNQKAA